MHINILYSTDIPAQNAPNYELIISDPGGNILIDTIANSAVPIKATLYTNDTLLDVAAVVPTVNPATYTIQLIRNVNPSVLAKIEPNDYRVRISPVATVPRSIVYTHLPPGTFTGTDPLQGILFTNYPFNEVSGISYNPHDPSGPTLEIDYQLNSNNYGYLSLPQDDMYSLHKQVNAIDTVDGSTLDTSVNLTFDRPYPFTINNQTSEFYGFPDTTDMTDIIAFTDFLVNATRPGVDFLYPSAHMQDYEMTLYGLTADNDGLYYYFYGTQPPHSLPFPTASDFNLTSTQPNDFSVTFPNNDHTFYFASWIGATVALNIIAPPGDNSFQPITWLTNQKSRLLASANYSDLTLKTFGIRNTNGMSYSAYTAYAYSQDAGQTRFITSDAGITKYFP